MLWVNRVRLHQWVPPSSIGHWYQQGWLRGIHEVHKRTCRLHLTRVEFLQSIDHQLSHCEICRHCSKRVVSLMTGTSLVISLKRSSRRLLSQLLVLREESLWSRRSSTISPWQEDPSRGPTVPKKQVESRKDKDARLSSSSKDVTDNKTSQTTSLPG